MLHLWPFLFGVLSWLIFICRSLTCQWVLALVPWLSLPRSVWSLSEAAVPCESLPISGCWWFSYLVFSLYSHSWSTYAVHSFHSFSNGGVIPMSPESFQILGYRVRTDSAVRSGLSLFRRLLLLGRSCENFHEGSWVAWGLCEAQILVESPPCRGPFVGHSVSSECSQLLWCRLQSGPQFSYQPLPSPLTSLIKLDCVQGWASVSCAFASNFWWFHWCPVSFPLSSPLNTCYKAESRDGMSALDTSWHLLGLGCIHKSHLTFPMGDSRVQYYLHYVYPL